MPWYLHGVGRLRLGWPWIITLPTAKGRNPVMTNDAEIIFWLDGVLYQDSLVFYQDTVYKGINTMTNRSKLYHKIYSSE